MKKALICMLQLHKKSGSARTAYENIKYFKDRGFETHVACMTMDRELVKQSGAIPHKMLPYFKSTGANRRRWYNWQVQRLRKKLKPDLTLGHADIDDQDVLTLHNCVFLASELIHQKPLDPKSEMALIHGKVLSEHRFKKMIANSEMMKKDSVKRYGIKDSDIHVICPALDTTVFYPTPNLRPSLRKRFGFSDKVIISLVTSGNLKKRGVDIFIEAINLLDPKVKVLADFRFVGKDQKDHYENALLTYDPPLSDIQSYYNAIDVFVLPARIEEFGRVVLEAMGCGVPVITTDKVGAGELLEGKSREFLIPSHDAKALSLAMERLILNESLRKSLGEMNVLSAHKEAEDRLFPKFDQVFKLD